MCCLETFCEIRRAVKSDAVGNLRNIPGALRKQAHCMPESDMADVSVGRKSCQAHELTVKLSLTHSSLTREFCNSEKCIIQIFFHELIDLLHKTNAGHALRCNWLIVDVSLIERNPVGQHQADAKQNFVRFKGTLQKIIPVVPDRHRLRNQFSLLKYREDRHVLQGKTSC